MKCRLCGCEDLGTILDMGHVPLSGIFPHPREEVERAPLHLVRCLGECGLVQLNDTADLTKMYGQNYGYRSGLNHSMVKHLQGLVTSIMKGWVGGKDPLDILGEVVVDIGSNDGTLLRAYPEEVQRVGIDPTAEKFRKYYPPGVEIIPEFFTAAAFRESLGDKKARIVTSIACFYDLPDPLAFARDVASILHPRGIWCLEMSYILLMMGATAFDTICHEHLEYYALRQIEWIAERAGLEVIFAQENDTNGGSIMLLLAHKGAWARDCILEDFRRVEQTIGLHRPEPYLAFAMRAAGAATALEEFLDEVYHQKVYGLGASTKGNILLEAVEANARVIDKIGDVNPDKWGCVTPGTNIPIISEEQALAENADYYVVLPWHFRKGFVENPKVKGRRLVFPSPQFEIVVP